MKKNQKEINKYRKAVFICLYVPTTEISVIKQTMKAAKTLSEQYDKVRKSKEKINIFWFDFMNLETELFDRVNRLAKKGF